MSIEIIDMRNGEFVGESSDESDSVPGEDGRSCVPRTAIDAILFKLCGWTRQAATLDPLWQQFTIENAELVAYHYSKEHGNIIVPLREFPTSETPITNFFDSAEEPAKAINQFFWNALYHSQNWVQIYICFVNHTTEHWDYSDMYRDFTKYLVENCTDNVLLSMALRDLSACTTGWWSC